MKIPNPNVIKSSGERVRFSIKKLRNSLLKSGASKPMVSSIINMIKKDLHQKISTSELYQKAFDLLKEYNGAFASRYKLKKSLYELGPSGFPFEKFVSEVLKCEGYKTKLNQQMQGKCVSHEVDILAERNSENFLIECKFRSDEGRKCDVKVPLYIHARFEDINASIHKNKSFRGWLITNTHFTKDAIDYGECMGLKLLSWDYPVNHGLKELIDKHHAYPITSSTLLTSEEKINLLLKNIILGKELVNKPGLLDPAKFSEERKEKILKEFGSLCNTAVADEK
ncbi:restriction endonuclease [Christiangramia aquimixticola]|uniref:restriction endonuclease n=1 Tax=Christiangramia aquimixticola TaxID=1697558 RepID=UPI003AA88CC3